MRVAQLALPRDQIPHISLDRPAGEVWDALRHSALGFVAVSSGGDLDDVRGYLTHEDLAAVDPYRSAPAPVETLRPLVFVAGGMAPVEALQRLDEHGARFAIVVDEYGQTVGMVLRQALAEVT